MYRDKTVFITGAGGSIGSALCKMIASQNPKLLIMFELNEYALYKIDQVLTCNRLAVLGDVKDKSRLDEFMQHVDVVFHCAAYKHVPLCESHNANEAHKNNYIGTTQVLESAKHVPSVVVLSTDKAINPISVMGDTKRMAEQAAVRYGRTVARLGNIIGSSGSVIPKFEEQILAGGPVTVTHCEATRYFIPMEQAVDFIVNTSTREPGIYMVDMGKPQSILKLAKKMIGEKKINIQFTGLRPGEKLHEYIA